MPVLSSVKSAPAIKVLPAPTNTKAAICSSLAACRRPEIKPARRLASTALTGGWSRVKTPMLPWRVRRTEAAAMLISCTIR